ncbi:MAG: ABC transporter ATP-binding protein [Clostridiaceae bacterium]
MQENNKSLLNIENLVVHYITGKTVVRAVNGISLKIEKGEALGLVGETGAGKTTTAYSIMQIIPNPPGKIISGKILFDGEDLNRMSNQAMKKIRGNKISMIFQDPMTALNPVFGVGEQIAEGIRLHENISKAQANIKAAEIMEKVGISAERFADYPHQFSGGMKQRIVIAIALACHPALLIADEPTTALDVTIQAQVLNLIQKLQKEMNTSLLLITHDLGVVTEVCQKAAIMYAGEIVEYGTLEHIYNNTKHPYTIGLFQSIPNFDENVRRLKPIQGMMSDPSNLPDGCYFAPRCPNASDACRRGKIPVVEAEPGHLVKCLKCGN